MKQSWAVVGGSALACLGLGTAGYAWFTSSASAPAAVTVGSLSAPTDVTAVQPVASARTVRVTWTAPTAPDGGAVAGYTVTRDDGNGPAPACDSGTTRLTSATTGCDDLSVPSGTYTYRVTAHWATWTTTGEAADPTTIANAALSRLATTSSTTTPAAGTPFTLTLTATDQYGDAVAGYSGARCLTFTGAATSPAPASVAPAYPAGAADCAGSVVTFNGGVGSAPVTLHAAGPASLQVTDTTAGVDGAVSLAVGAGAPGRFALAASTSTPAAGAAVGLTLRVHDAYDNLVTGYTGSRSVTWSGLATSPAPAAAAPLYPPTTVEFAGGEAVTALSATGYAAGAQTLRIDDPIALDAGTAALTVAPGAASRLALAPSTSTPQAGSAFTLGLTARDAYDNLATSFAGTRTVSWSGLGTSPAPASRTPDYPTASVAFSSGTATTALSATGYAAGLSTLSAATSGLTGSATVSVGAASAVRYGVQAPPTATAGIAISVTITALDAYDNPTNHSASPTLTWSGPANAPSGDSPTYPNAVPFIGAAATPSVTLVKAETTSLTVTSPGLTGTSGTITVGVGAAARLAFGTQPPSTTNGGAIMAASTVRVLDAYANPTTATSSITMSLGANPGPGTLSGSTTVAAVNGLATFSSLSVDRAAANYTLVASSAGLTSATSSTFTIVVGPPARLAFTSQPSGATAISPPAAAIFPGQPIVAVQDLGGNTVTSWTTPVTLTLTNLPAGSKATLSCTANPVTPVQGVATFSGCAVRTAGNGYTLQATSGTLPATTSQPFNVTTTGATRLAFSTTATAATAATAWAQQPVVSFTDDAGTVVTATPATAVTLSITGVAGASLTCEPSNTATSSSGVASFAGCRIDRAGTYTLTATATGVTAATTQVTVSVGPAVRVAVTRQPAGCSAGAACATQPTFAVHDAGGNVVSSHSTPLTLTVASGTGTAGAALTCSTNPLAPTAGEAAFAGCGIDLAGSGYALTASSGSLTPGTTSAFDVTSPVPTQLGFTTQPSSATAGTALGQQPRVTVQDANGNTMPTAAASVTLAITSGTGGAAGAGAVLSCDQPGNTVATVNGVAIFTGCRVERAAAGYTLTATASGLTSATSTAFTITNGPAAALAFARQPAGCAAATACTTQPVVAVWDAYGNLVRSSTAAITLSITPGTGTTGATLTCNANPVNAGNVFIQGNAYFGGCRISLAGTGYTLRATSGTLTAATSDPFNVT